MGEAKVVEALVRGRGFMGDYCWSIPAAAVFGWQWGFVVWGKVGVLFGIILVGAVLLLFWNWCKWLVLLF